MQLVLDRQEENRVQGILPEVCVAATYTKTADMPENAQVPWTGRPICPVPK